MSEFPPQIVQTKVSRGSTSQVKGMNPVCACVAVFRRDWKSLVGFGHMYSNKHGVMNNYEPKSARSGRTSRAILSYQKLVMLCPLSHSRVLKLQIKLCGRKISAVE